VQPYEPSRQQSSYRHGQVAGSSGIPGMRVSYEQPAGSTTPIYDSLCAEYRRLFRALPGDRSGEEELRFAGFGPLHGASGWHGGYGRHPEPTYSGYASYTGHIAHAGQAVSPGHPVHSGYAGHATHTANTTHTAHFGHSGGTRTGRALPAALPPARQEPQSVGTHELTPGG
jgi:hypothetical protein